MKPLKIYIAGPYSSDDPMLVQFNVETAMKAAINIYKKGHYPYCPHLTHYVHSWALRVLGESLEYEQWMSWDSVWVTACDAILHLGHSKGADRELAQAEAEGKIIFLSVAEVPVATGHDD